MERARTGRGRLLGVVCAIAFAVAPQARAEQGALTASLRGAALGTTHVPAHVEDASMRAALLPAAALELRWAPRHALELGVELGWGSAPLRAADVRVQGLDGDLTYGLDQGWGAAVGRWWLPGWQWRPFVTARLGLGLERARGFAHLLPAGEGDSARYELALADRRSPGVLAGMGAGVERAWDHLALGVRADVAGVLGADPSARGELSVYASWSWYP